MGRVYRTVRAFSTAVCRRASAASEGVADHGLWQHAYGGKDGSPPRRDRLDAELRRRWPGKVRRGGYVAPKNGKHGYCTDVGSEVFLFFLVYASSAVRPFSRPDLSGLLATSRENNARLGITGMLLYKDGNFMQALEGEEGAVRALYERIGTDPRHRGEITLLEGHSEERQFPDWSMGFRDLNSLEGRNAPGYSEFLNAPLTGQEFSDDPTRAQKLLLTFKRTM